MKSYGELAKIYDKLMDHIDYAAYTDFYLSLAAKHGWKGRKILDLACGTGNISLELLKQGYEVQGLDISEEMLMVADEKIYGAGFTPRLYRQNMRNFQLMEKVDLVISAFDSLNYLLKEEDLERTFSCVYRALDEHGLFLFDVHSYHKFTHVLGQNTLAYAGDDLCYIWQNNFSGETGICEMNLDIFLREKGAIYRRFQEYHRERYYSEAQLKHLLERNNFTVLAIYDDLKYTAPHPKAERLFYVAQKA
jgi:predicted TPR repeat methyltransferase